MEEKEVVHLPEVFQAEEIFRVDLSPEELKALSMLLPRSYTLHVDNRKKDKSHPKKKNPEEIIPSNSQLPVKSNAVAVSVVPLPPKKGAQKPELIPEALKPCVKILQQLKQHKCAWPFMEPVDAEGLGIPQYHEIIKQPMDLTTLEANLRSGFYQTAPQFHLDILKIFKNSYTFNEAYEDFLKITHEFERYYYRISGQIKPPPEKNSAKPQLAPSKQQKKKKKVPSGASAAMDSQPITTEEKKELAYHIHKLAKEHIKGVRNIVFDSNSDHTEFDLEKLSQKKLRELQKFIRNKLTEMDNNLRFNMLEKSEHHNLDEFESQITEQFIDQPLEAVEALDELG